MTVFPATGWNRLGSDVIHRAASLRDPVRRGPTRLALLLATLLAPGAILAVEIDGFAEPYEEVRVAAPETGIIARIAVTEGQAVESGEVLAELDNRLLEGSLEVADARRKATGAIEAASADHDRKVRRLELLRGLLASGSARDEEVVRAEADALVAAATLQSAREEQHIAALEYERIRERMDYRTLRSPTAGVVTELILKEGEFVTSQEPWVLRVSRIDRLRVEVHVPVDQVGHFEAGGSVQVEFPQSQVTRQATVDYVAPIVDPKSGTIVVKLVVDNSALALRAGQRALVRTGP